MDTGNIIAIIFAIAGAIVGGLLLLWFVVFIVWAVLVKRLFKKTLDTTGPFDSLRNTRR